MVSTSEQSIMIPVYYNKAFVNKGSILVAKNIFQKVEFNCNDNLKSLSKGREKF